MFFFYIISRYIIGIILYMISRYIIENDIIKNTVICTPTTFNPDQLRWRRVQVNPLTIGKLRQHNKTDKLL